MCHPFCDIIEDENAVELVEDTALGGEGSEDNEIEDQERDIDDES